MPRGARRGRGPSKGIGCVWELVCPGRPPGPWNVPQREPSHGPFPRGLGPGLSIGRFFQDEVSLRSHLSSGLYFRAAQGHGCFHKPDTSDSPTSTRYAATALPVLTDSLQRRTAPASVGGMSSVLDPEVVTSQCSVNAACNGLARARGQETGSALALHSLALPRSEGRLLPAERSLSEAPASLCSGSSGWQGLCASPGVCSSGSVLLGRNHPFTPRLPHARGVLLGDGASEGFAVGAAGCSPTRRKPAPRRPLLPWLGPCRSRGAQAAAPCGP